MAVSSQPILVCGIAGRMGARIVHLLQTDFKDFFYIAAGTEHQARSQVSTSNFLVVEDFSALPKPFEIAAIIDFTTPAATLGTLQFALESQIPLVIGTTGFSAEQKQLILAASQKIPICFSPNMSVGVNLLFRLVAEAARFLGDDYDVEVIEAHHRLKKDAPSGTAMQIAEVLLDTLKRSKDQLRYERHGAMAEREPKEIGMQTIRGGDIVGEHTVLFAGLGERLEITHRATNRDNFARGAILAAKWLMQKVPGLYTMQDVLGL